MIFLKWSQSDQSVPIGSNYFFLQGTLTFFKYLGETGFIDFVNCTG